MKPINRCAWIAAFAARWAKNGRQVNLFIYGLELLSSTLVYLIAMQCNNLQINVHVSIFSCYFNNKKFIRLIVCVCFCCLERQTSVWMAPKQVWRLSGSSLGGFFKENISLQEAHMHLNLQYLRNSSVSNSNYALHSPSHLA